MSIQMFPGVGGANKGQPAKDAATGADIAAYAEYILKIAVNVGSVTGSRKTAMLEFGVTGTSQDNCDSNAGDVAQAIVDASKGYIVAFMKKLGKFRIDEGNSASNTVPVGTSQYGVLTWTNGNVEGSSILPVQSVDETMNGQLYIPYVDVDTMAGSALTNLTALIRSNSLARARFADDKRDSFVVGVSHDRLGVAIKDFGTTTYGTLASNDESAGISDGVLRDR